MDDFLWRLRRNPKIIVLLFGYCVHIGRNFQTFLTRCSDTGIFSGFDISFGKYRIVALRINHLARKTVLERVEEHERNLEQSHV